MKWNTLGYVSFDSMKGFQSPMSLIKYMDELYHQYKSLFNVYKGHDIARNAWDGVDYKEEWQESLT